MFVNVMLFASIAILLDLFIFSMIEYFFVFVVIAVAVLAFISLRKG